MQGLWCIVYRLKTKFTHTAPNTVLSFSGEDGGTVAEGVGLMGRRRAFAEEAKDRHQ